MAVRCGLLDDRLGVRDLFLLTGLLDCLFGLLDFLLFCGLFDLDLLLGLLDLFLGGLIDCDILLAL